MKTFLRYYLKYIILAIVFIGAIAAAGIINVGKIVEVEEKKSSYTRTQFDFYISSPSPQQVEDIEGDPSVDKVFPFYAFSNAFPNKNSAREVWLLASDDMDDSGISLITQKTCIEGGYDKTGAMLDNLAAQRLGVGVGDKLSFTLMNKVFTFNVAGIYLTSTFGTLKKGIVLINFTDEMKNALKPANYGGAFITAKDKEGVTELLKDYIGEGSGSSKGQVADKEDDFALIKDNVESTERGINTLNISVAIASGVLFLILNIVFTVTNRKNDLLRRDDGMRYIVMAGLYALTSLITAAVIAGAGFGIIYLAAAKTFFAADCIKTALYCTLPVLIAAPVVIAFVFIYLGRMYANSAA